MSDGSRSCARCHGVAVVVRGNASYCMKCNEIMDWSEVIAVVQAAEEPAVAVAEPADVTAAIASDDAAASGQQRQPAPADIGHGDPFARRPG